VQPSAAAPNSPTPAQQAASIAKGLSAQLVALESPDAGFMGMHLGRNWDGQLYVATPQLLHAFGIDPSEIDPHAEVLSSRPGLSRVSGLDFNYGAGGKYAPHDSSTPCTAATTCIPNPVVQQIGALPTGTSAPNTVLSEYAMRTFHITASTADWLIQSTHPFTAAQINSAEHAAAAAGLSVEAKNDAPSSYAVITWATLFAILIALGVLGMSVGLVRSETGRDLRTLAATGASGATRRTLTAVTAGALGLLGAVLGTIGGYVAMVGWLRGNSLNGGIAALGNIPVTDLVLVVLAMPGFAAIVGWVLAGREPSAIARQPIE
jgi:putative ABC transport system permease protein